MLTCPATCGAQDLASMVREPSIRHWASWAQSRLIAIICRLLSIEHENVRKALAFWREGKRLDEVHDSYAFLSFYKVIESQFSDTQAKVHWITANIDKLTDRAAKRVSELRADGIDVSRHLFDSGRCAVAHASLNGNIVDPDIPADRRRLSEDLVIMEDLARVYIRDELKVPDSRSLYRTRNRLEPWATFLPPDVLDLLKQGGTPEDMLGGDNYLGRSATIILAGRFGRERRL
jgi:hypothetical protein